MNSDFGNKTFPHIDLLFTYALLIIGDNRNAEKIISQTFAKAFWFWKHLSEETDIQTWLMRILINISRSLPGESKSVDDQIIENKTIDFSSITALDIDRELDYQQNKLLRQLISSLPLKFKEVIIFTDVLKFSYEHTADLLEVPEDVLKRRLFNARTMILFKWMQGHSNKSTAENVQISLQDKLSIISLVDNQELEVTDDERTHSLKQEIDSQILLKNSITKNISLQPVRQALNIKLLKKYAPHLTDKLNNVASPEKKGIVKLVTIATIILVTILIILFRPIQENPGEYAINQKGKDNILVLLKNNYSMFLDGSYDSIMISGEEIKTGIFKSADEVQIRISPPGLSGWKIKSLFFSSVREIKLANVIYQNEAGENLYLMQIPLRLVEEKKILNLTPELMNYLDTNHCYSVRNEAKIFLLKKTEEHILGFALENPKKELILEICSSS